MGCGEGDRAMIHFLIKEDTAKLAKVLKAVDANSYMVLLGTVLKTFQKWSIFPILIMIPFLLN